MAFCSASHIFPHPNYRIANRRANPRPVPPLAYSMRLLPAILANIVWFAAALGFGSLSRSLFPKTFAQLDRFAFMLLAGLGLIGTLLFCIGQLWFSRAVVVSTLLFGLILIAKYAPRIFRGLRAIPSVISGPLLPLSIVAIVLLVTGISGLALPTGDMSHDAIAYHYLGPKVWLREHRIRPVPDEILTSFPALVETQFAAVMSIGGQRAPRFFVTTSLIAILLVTAGWTMRLGLDRSAAWWTAALIASMPAVFAGVHGGFIDALSAAFVLAAARMAFDSETRRHYVLFGLFCGFAMATKYTALISFFLLLLCSLVISFWSRHQDRRALAKHLAISCGIALVVASPVYLRNWILFGCPIYPPPRALLRVFTVSSLLPSVLQELERNVRESGIGMGPGILHFLLLPFNLTYHTANFNGAGGIGLVPLALGPLGVFVSRRNALAKGLVLFAVLQTLAWFVTAQTSRYLIPVYGIAAIMGVIGWKYVAGTPSTFARALAALVVSVSVLYGLVMILPGRRDELHAVFSPSFEVQRRMREVPFLESFEFVNNNPSVTKVLILNRGIPAFYLDKTYIKPLGRWGEQTLPDATDPQKVLLLVPGLQVSHVMDLAWPSETFRLPDHPPGLTLIFERPGQRVFRVDSFTHPAAASRSATREETNTPAAVPSAPTYDDASIREPLLPASPAIPQIWPISISPPRLPQHLPVGSAAR
jgi:hypothetical protein